MSSSVERSRSQPPPAPTPILVVSPTLSTLRTLSPYLKEVGYSPLLYHLPRPTEPAMIAAESPIDGMVHVFHPHLLLLDVDFGEEQRGWQLIQALQLLPATAALPCVVCIAATEYGLELMPHLLTHGIRVVLKPYTRDELWRNLWAACPPAVARPVTALSDRQPPFPAVGSAADTPHHQTERVDGNAEADGTDTHTDDTDKKENTDDTHLRAG